MPYWPYRISSRQCCGHWFWSARSGSRRAKISDKTEQKRWKNFTFWSAGCSLLRAKGFSCSLTVLYRRIGKKNSKKLLFSSCKILHLLVIKKTLFPNPDWNQCGSTALLPGAHSVKKIRAQKFRSGYRHPPAEVDLTSFLLTSLFSPAEVDWRNSLLTCWSGLDELSPHLSLLTCWSGLEELSPHLLKWTGGNLSFTFWSGLKDLSPHLLKWTGRTLSLLTCWSGLEEKNSLLTCWSGLKNLSHHLLKWTGGTLFSSAEVDLWISLLTCWSGLMNLSSHLLKWTDGSLFSPAEVD